MAVKIQDMGFQNDIARLESKIKQSYLIQFFQFNLTYVLMYSGRENVIASYTLQMQLEKNRLFFSKI
jgi:hypothetical protein